MSKIKITLKGQPKSTQKIYQFTCRGLHPIMYMTQEGSDIKEDYAWQAKAQYKGKPLSERLKLTIELFFGTKRVSDWDNFHKLSMDALTGIVWEDDSQIYKATVIKRYDKENPRIIIKIENYE